MKKKLYIIGATITLVLIILLLVSQIILSLNIKKEIIQWCNNHDLESSNFKCYVNLITGNITLKGWTLKKGDNEFLINKARISKLFDLFSKKNIRLVHIQKANIKLKHFPLFYPSSTIDNPSKNPFLIDEFKIDNSTLSIELPDANKTQDINLEALFRKIGANRNTIFSVKAIANSSSLEIDGDFNFDDWKKHMTYEVLGKDVSLNTVNILEEGFLPSEVRGQLLSLYFKDILMVNLKGKLDISGNGEIKEESINSQLKFLVSDLSCETENERIKSLVKKISTKGYLEINYKIYGTIQNPYLTYDILF